MTGTLCHSRCTVSEHVCLCSVHVKHCKALELLQWAWSAAASVERCPTFCFCCAGCKKYAVLFRKHVSRQGAGKGKAILECVGLTREQIKLCYQSNPLNREEAIQGGHCTWQGILEAMKFAVVAAQHCRELEEELCQWKRCKIIFVSICSGTQYTRTLHISPHLHV